MSSVTYEMIALAFLKQCYLIKQSHSAYDNTKNTENESFFILAIRVEDLFIYFFIFLGGNHNFPERISRTMECRTVSNAIIGIFQT